ncbi:MAG: hypothetical protein ACRELB_00685 [Polyangiaceae bacterium]
MRSAARALLAALLLANAACSTHYVPQSSGRIAVVMDPGMGLYKDGKTYRPGIFGGDVDEAVAGNQRAEEEASSYQNEQTVGFGCMLAGVAAIIAGGLVLGADYPQNGQTNGLPPSLGLMLGGVVANLVGVGFTMSAQTHLWDAVNVYNDGVGRGTRTPVAP